MLPTKVSLYRINNTSLLYIPKRPLNVHIQRGTGLAFQEQLGAAVNVQQRQYCQWHQGSCPRLKDNANAQYPSFSSCNIVFICSQYDIQIHRFALLIYEMVCRTLLSCHSFVGLCKGKHHRILAMSTDFKVPFSTVHLPFWLSILFLWLDVTL